MKTNRFEIKSIIDLMIAERMLSEHNSELLTQITERAIFWQKGIIAELTESIQNYTN